MLPLLTACNDFDEEFSVRSAESTVTVSRDGFARVSETFIVRALVPQNYGGVYVDIPQRFVDGEGGAHWRDFLLLAARREGRDEHYSLENGVRGRSIYIGERHCKRCSPDLPVGMNEIGIEYRLGRLVREEAGRQILALPAYLGSIHDLRAEKKVKLTVPAGGKLLSSGSADLGYEVRSMGPNEFLISFNTRNADRTPLDLEIEYPLGTFAAATAADAVYWWATDKVLVFFSLAGPLIALSYLLVIVLAYYQSTRMPPSKLDTGVFEKVSPTVAAFIAYDWQQRASMPAFRACVCKLAIEGNFRISGLDYDLRAVGDPMPEDERKLGSRLLPGSVSSTGIVRNRILKAPSHGGFRRVFDVFDGVGPELLNAADREYRQYDSQRAANSIYTMLCIVASGAVTAYFAGLLTVTFAGCMLLVLPLVALTKILRPSSLPGPTSERERLKQNLSLAIGVPIGTVWALIYVAGYPLGADERPYAIAIGLHVIGLVVVSLLRRVPSSKQRQLRDNVFLLRRYILGEISGPAMSVETYARYLPFAIALDAESAWIASFGRWRKEIGMEVYEPDWLIRPAAQEA
ncbi:DUF2207 family protein [Rhizobium cremeum]|uniref:DUF2207 family protein n=1 Tax=Rhizobium cremeum TaxID=2813827 RepID=UPI0013B02910